jgi:hypothetical protein
MARKTEQKGEMFPPADTPKSAANDPNLDNALDAAGGTPEQNLQPPPIQAANKPFTIEDCYANESDPPPTPPQKYSTLRHGGGLPKSAFRILPREKGKKNLLNMVAIPFGESEPGQSFSYPLPGKLVKPVAQECPTLTIKRYEARIAVDAAGNPSIVEVPFDPLVNKIGEQNRQSLLKVIEVAETKAILANKLIGGSWGHVEAPDFEPIIPEQSQAELINLTYGPDFITSLDSMILRKFRRKTSQSE